MLRLYKVKLGIPVNNVLIWFFYLLKKILIYSNKYSPDIKVSQCSAGPTENIEKNLKNMYVTMCKSTVI